MAEKLNIYFESLDDDLRVIWKNVKSELSAKRVLRWVSEAELRRHAVSLAQVIDGTNTQDKSLWYYVHRDESEQYEQLNDPALKAVVGRTRGGESFVIVGRGKPRKGKLIAFVDAPHRPELPDEFVKIKWVSTWKELANVYRQEITFSNLLEDDSKFRRTGWMARNEHADTPIYEGIRGLYRGFYFYRDQKHEDHYEVYDGRFNHYGELKRDGTIDESKKDPRKRWPVRT